ncbi:MAG TPA: polysaccharide pyruvyl transferase family protein, partial [Armatimonadota bacterium]|nr:polysaccharide pyruvyl transferase family protein [Armatimonadota bacterium]
TDETSADFLFDAFMPRVADTVMRENTEFREALRRTKLIVYNSGMVLVFGEGTLAGGDFWGYTVPRALPLLVANRLGIPYGVYAHSFDSFGGVPGQALFRRLLDEAAFVFCRERDSLRYLEGTGIADDSRMFVPDSTLSFVEREDAWARAFMARHGLRPGRFLVVVPRTWLGDTVVRDAIGEARSKAHMATLRTSTEAWIRSTGMQVVIAVEVEDELPHARRLVYEALPDDVRRRCVMMEDFWLPDQAAGLYRHARGLLTMELHSYLLAFGQETPALVATFAESGRKVEMVRDFGQPEMLLDIDRTPPGAVAKAVRKMNDEHDHVQERMQSVLLPSLRRIEQKALDIVAQAVA